MRTRITSLLVVLMLAMAGHAQTVVSFSVEQPLQFVVDAGPDLVYEGSPIVLGGSSTATGGGGQFTYAWQPAAGLSDPTLANPVLLDLPATTVFTVTVTDMALGCVKVDQVEVLRDPSIGMAEQEGAWGRIYPNPATNEVWVEAKDQVRMIAIRTLTGQDVLRTTDPSSGIIRLDLGQVPEGLYLLTVSLSSGELITYKLCKASSDR
jgi:hypothetical protein